MKCFGGSTIKHVQYIACHCVAASLSQFTFLPARTAEDVPIPDDLLHPSFHRSIGIGSFRKFAILKKYSFVG